MLLAIDVIESALNPEKCSHRWAFVPPQDLTGKAFVKFAVDSFLSVFPATRDELSAKLGVKKISSSAIDCQIFITLPEQPSGHLYCLDAGDEKISLVINGMTKIYMKINLKEPSKPKKNGSDKVGPSSLSAVTSSVSNGELPPSIQPKDNVEKPESSMKSREKRKKDKEKSKDKKKKSKDKAKTSDPEKDTASAVVAVPPANTHKDRKKRSASEVSYSSKTAKKQKNVAKDVPKASEPSKEKETTTSKVSADAVSKPKGKPKDQEDLPLEKRTKIALVDYMFETFPEEVLRQSGVMTNVQRFFALYNVGFFQVGRSYYKKRKKEVLLDFIAKCQNGAEQSVPEATDESDNESHATTSEGSTETESQS